MGTAGHTAFAAGQRTGLKDHDDFDATVKHTAQVVEGIMGPGARIYPKEPKGRISFTHKFDDEDKIAMLKAHCHRKRRRG